MGPEGEEAESGCVLAGVGAMHGSAMRQRRTGGRASLWGQTPWIWGASSALAPGGCDPRADLAEPIAQRLFFAGEAIHPIFCTAAHGAWESGQRAAAEAIAALQPAAT